MKLIVAMDINGGIGYKGILPWKCREDLNHFRTKTMNKTIVLGRKTVQEIPQLKGRKILCLSGSNWTGEEEWVKKNNIKFVTSLEYLNDNVIIAGGEKVYKTAIASGRITKIYRTIIKGSYECDTFFKSELLQGFIITQENVSELTGNKYQVLIPEDSVINKFCINSTRGAKGEYQYLKLLSDIYRYGIDREGRNGKTRSLFMNTCKFDLRSGFPLLTTKKMFTRGILEEFLFFLRGDTDTTILSNSKVKIWESNTSKEFLKAQNLNYSEGVMGPMYGYQWRHFNAPYKLDEEGKPVATNEGIDQLKYVIELIKHNPTSRRILMTSYNPVQSQEGVLFPCHSIVIQFFVDRDFLDMSCYNRSQDVFLGVPYNIASSSLLLSVISKITNKTPRYFTMIMGDTHLYTSHFPQAFEQMKRIPYSFPTIIIPEISNIKDVEKLKTKDFILKNYKCYKSIKATMIA